MSEKQPQFDTKTRLWCSLAYFPVLFFLPLVFCHGDERAKFHANQGLVLFLAYAIGNAIISLVCIFVHSPEVKNAIYTICNLVCVCFSILGILHVCRDQETPLPIIGGIKIIR